MNKVELLYTYLIFSRGFNKEFNMDTLNYYFKKGNRTFYGVEVNDGGWVKFDNIHPTKVHEFLSIYFGFTEDKELLNENILS